MYTERLVEAATLRPCFKNGEISISGDQTVSCETCAIQICPQTVIAIKEK
jgi:formate hydrogenlyase subunit 6/NADH:ubiquinone oxidoreductase subunit I